MGEATRPWRQIRRDGSPDSRIREELIKRAMTDALALGELRAALEIKQSEMAARMGTNQPGISRLERREDLYLSTLRDYVAALGGELQLVAEFPDGMTVRLEPAKEAVSVG